MLRKRLVPQEVEIPTASMADIAFLLIIFFMTTTIFARDKGLKLLLPEKKEEVVKVKSENLIKISINDLGQVYLGDQEVNISALKEMVQNKIKENPKLITIIQPHPKTKYERVIEVFDALKEIKNERVSLSIVRI